MNNKILLTGLVLASLAGTSMAAGVNNTVDPNAAGYGAEAYGKSNTITATGTSAFAVGFENTVSGANSFAYGHKNTVTGANSFAGGEKSEAKGYASVAIGSSAQALSDYTFAIGSQARTNGENTVAFGNGTYASNTNALAMGYSTTAAGKDSIAVGSYIKSNSENNVAIGNNITTESENSIGIGSTVTTNSNNSVGIGSKVTTNLDRSIGIGNGVITNFNNVGIGNGVISNVKDTVAIGNGVTSNGESSVAIGTGIYANGVKTVSIGTNVNAAGVSSIVVGRDTTVNGDDTTVVGANNGAVKAAQSAVVGYNNKVVGTDPEQLIFGSNSKTQGQGAIAIGTHVETLAIDAVAFGNNTIADKSNSVALGTNSVTDNAVNQLQAMVNNTTYVFAGTDATSVVSVGSKQRAGFGGVKNYVRQVQNVAAGRVDASSTDAVNGSQLHAAYDAINTMGEDINKALDAQQQFNTAVHNTLANHKDAIKNNAQKINTLDQKVVTNTADIRALEHTALDHEGRITVLESENKDIKSAISDNSKLIDKNTENIAKNTSDIKALDNKINDVGRNALERANHYTDLQVNKGVAKASALAGLKFLDYNPKDKWSFAASVGHYRNTNAVAVGAAYQPNENTMVHGGITLDGKVAYNLGVSFKTGGQKQVTRHELEEQIRQLENNNIRMQEELNEIRAMLEKK